MVSFGIGEVLGGMSLGIVIDKIGSRNTSIVNIIIAIAVVTSTIFSVIS
jgi:predicted MFS family arabinose efflux permease